MTVRSIDFSFACDDRCLDKMVPSDLRMLVAERDRYRKALEEIIARERCRSAEAMYSTAYRIAAKALEGKE